MAGKIRGDGNISSEINRLLYMQLAYDNSFGSIYRGWKTDLLVERPKGLEEKFLLCFECMGVLRDACLVEIDGKQELRCSVCIPPLNANKLVIAHLNREAVNNKHVYCPLKLKGCSWTNEISRILHHLEECELFPMECPLGCRDGKGNVCRVERGGMELHKTRCPMSVTKSDWSNIRVHSPSKASQQHQVCSDQEIKCPYSQYGCEVVLERRRMDQHEKEEIHKHLRLAMLNIGSMKNEVAILRTENEQKEIEFRSLLTTISTWISKGYIKWKINGIKNKILQRRKYYSDPFYVGLYKFQGCIDSNDNGDVSVLLQVMKGEWDENLKWPFRYRYSIRLVNKSHNNDDYEKFQEITKDNLQEYPQCFQKPITERNECFETAKFISQADLFKMKYSKGYSINLDIGVEQMLISD